ncbi:MAG: DUF6502 family protein [Pseudomonadota bacterium]
MSEFARAACRRLLRPIARMLLRLGLSWKEFAEIAKVVFVEIAREDYGLHGRPTNASRVAMMTGLSRREVGEIRKRLESEAPLDVAPRSRLSRVLTGWHNDPEFSEHGLPSLLGADQFRALARRYAGDIPDRAITKEMIALELMRERDEQYEVLQRDYVRDPADADIVRQMSQSLHDHGVSLAHNLNPHDAAPWFEGQASNTNMPQGSVEKLNRLLQTDAQEFLELVDTWLSDHELPSDDGAERCRVGVGVYLYEYPNDSDTQ